MCHTDPILYDMRVSRYAQAVRCTTKCAIFRPTQLGKGDAALSRCIPLACGASVRHFRAMHRLAVASPVKRAFKLPRHPHDQREIVTLPLEPHRPTLCGLDVRYKECLPEYINTGFIIINDLF